MAANRTFLLQVVERSGGSFNVAAWEQNAGSDHDATVIKPALRRDLEQLHQLILPAEASRRGGAIGKLNRRADEAALRKLGEAVFDFLLPPKVKALLKESTRLAIEANQNLRVHLELTEAPSLAHLPWEVAFDQRFQQHFCLMPFLPIHRSAQAENFFARVDPHLRILGMVASTPVVDEDGRADPLQSEREQEAMIKALEQLEPRPDLHWTGAGTREELTRRAKDNRGWTVFHFIGHGGFDTADGEGYLVLDAAGGWDPLYADELLPLFAMPAVAPQLVVLNCCSGAAGMRGHPFSSTAATLVRGGIRAVIAMQFEITEAAALLFSSRFYAAVARGMPIGRALTETRLEMRRTTQEWVTPALYMTGDDFALVPEKPAGG